MRIIRLLSFIVLFWSLPGWALDILPPSSLYHNREAAKGFKSENSTQALEQSTQGLASDPFRFEHHLNIALALEASGQMDKALQAYEAAAKYAQNSEQKFLAAFNLAQLYGKAKNIEKALESYQEALNHMPASREAKHNIELLIQQSQSGGEGEDQKDQSSGGGQGQQQQKPQDQKDKKDEGKDDKSNEQKKEPQGYQGSQKYKPRPFKGQELSPEDVKQILGELKQQEQKIRSEFNRRDSKEEPLDKDW